LVYWFNLESVLMSNISQFFAGRRKQNRRIIHGSVGVTTVTWRVPPGVTEVEVHCWGGGGGTFGYPIVGGGGGGGYVTHVFPVTPSDSLLITAGAVNGGTSSVSVPTQSPISPISATGGSGASLPNPGFSAGGAGGVGAYTIAPGISTARTFSASGGSGAPAEGGNSFAGGGAAGSPFGKGGNGSFALSPNGIPGGGGGGIGGPGNSGTSGAGGGSLGEASGAIGGLGKNGYKVFSSVAAPANAGFVENTSGDSDWFYVDEILGAGGSVNSIHGGAGGGGCFPGGRGGILGGGAGSGPGGLGGGGGGGAVGGAGLVILYW
jgi:hypothetical protein